jgi:hypothetical protein
MKARYQMKNITHAYSLTNARKDYPMGTLKNQLFYRTKHNTMTRKELTTALEVLGDQVCKDHPPVAGVLYALGALMMIEKEGELAIPALELINRHEAYIKQLIKRKK